MRILEKPRISLKWVTPNSEKEIESAGRVCWESWGKSDGTLDGENGARAFIRRIRGKGHIDVLEEAEMSVWCEGSRTFSHQLVRHRTQHHLQASQRYIKASEPEVMVPPSIRTDVLKYEVFKHGVQNAYADYKYFSDAGVRREDARFILPAAALTKIKAKANFNNWRKFIEYRSYSGAQWEIRMVSNAILSMANYIAPSVFEDLAEQFLTDDVELADIVDLEEFGVPGGQTS